MLLDVDIDSFSKRIPEVVLQCRSSKAIFRDVTIYISNMYSSVYRPLQVFVQFSKFILNHMNVIHQLKQNIIHGFLTYVSSFDSQRVQKKTIKTDMRF